VPKSRIDVVVAAAPKKEKLIKCEKKKKITGRKVGQQQQHGGYVQLHQALSLSPLERKLISR
jgi:hypothetical protein